MLSNGNKIRRDVLSTDITELRALVTYDTLNSLLVITVS